MMGNLAVAGWKQRWEAQRVNDRINLRQVTAQTDKAIGCQAYESQDWDKEYQLLVTALEYEFAPDFASRTGLASRGRPKPNIALARSES